MNVNNFYLIIGHLKINENICNIYNYKIFKNIDNNQYKKLNYNFLLRKINNNYQFLNLLILYENNHYLDILKLNINNNNINIILKDYLKNKLVSNKEVKILLFYDNQLKDIFINYKWSNLAFKSINEIKKKNKLLKMFYKIDIKKFLNIFNIHENQNIEISEIIELKTLLNNNNIKNIIVKKTNIKINLDDLKNFESIKIFLENNNFIFK